MAWDWDKLQQQKKARQGGPPPQVDDVLEKLKDMKGRFPGAWMIIVLIVLIFLGYTMIYKIDPEEVGVVQRFGRHVRTTTPGLNIKWPAGIETLTKVPVTLVQKEEFGFRADLYGSRSRIISQSSYNDESLMLTGDLNVAIVPWVVQYNIKDPYNYLFKVRDVKATLRDLSESTMRLVVGDRSITEVINKRDEIAAQARGLLQKELDEAETGLNITTIEMQRTNVPDPVQPSWNEVNQAGQEKERMIYEAREQYNKMIPQAKGQAEKTIREAEGYALDRVNRAQGDAARFLSLYEQYSKAKDVTKRRLYLEALKDVFPKLGNKYIIDDQQKNLLPLLNLDKSRTSAGGER
ncbi:MAG: FtsH protease activity modulator HflK [Deltaproteobacteria bacterium]|nr:FtsH protease activity modulator HflK [Deltaproteobacteria bacterium]